MQSEHQVPIWFFIGALLLIYGVVILGVGLWHLVSPPPPEARVALYDLHADIWWGALMALTGALYVTKFRPDRKQA